MNSLDQPLDDLIESCTGCPRHCQGKVHAKGLVLPTEALKLLVVVDSASSLDLNEGELLTDLAGQFFLKLLAMAGFNRNNTRITSLLKCGQDWDESSAADFEHCKKWLWKEIQARPSVVLALGNIASSVLLRKPRSSLTLKEEIGVRSVEYMAIPLAIYYSPEYILSHGKKLHQKTVEFLKELHNAPVASQNVPETTAPTDPADPATSVNP